MLQADTILTRTSLFSQKLVTYGFVMLCASLLSSVNEGIVGNRQRHVKKLKDAKLSVQSPWEDKYCTDTDTPNKHCACAEAGLCEGYFRHVGNSEIRRKLEIQSLLFTWSLHPIKS